MRKKKINVYLPKKIKDHRGFLIRLFCKKKLNSNLNTNIKQINYVYVKRRGTIKGFHAQIGRYKEDKYIICLQGAINDYFFKLEKKIKIFKRKLTADKIKILYIPKNYAHGFQTLTNDVFLLYLHTNFYNKKKEININPLDKNLKINWKIKKIVISKKDKSSKKINELFKL